MDNTDREDPTSWNEFTPNSSHSLYEDDEPKMDDFYTNRKIEDIRFLGRPDRWYLGSIFTASSTQGSYHRLSNLQRNVNSDSQGKRVGWERHIGTLSEFFPIKIVDEALRTVLSYDSKLNSDETLLVYLLGAIDALLRIRNHSIIPHETYETINRVLMVNISEGEVKKARYQLCQKIAELRIRNPQHTSNMIMRRIASTIVADHMLLTPEEKRWALRKTIEMTKQMLDDQFYPNCPEAYGYGLALLVINTLHKAKNLPRCRIPSSDPHFRKKVSTAMLRFKKRFNLEVGMRVSH